MTKYNFYYLSNTLLIISIFLKLKIHGIIEICTFSTRMARVHKRFCHFRLKKSIHQKTSTGKVMKNHEQDTQSSDSVSCTSCSCSYQIRMKAHILSQIRMQLFDLKQSLCTHSQHLSQSVVLEQTGQDSDQDWVLVT